MLGDGLHRPGRGRAALGHGVGDVHGLLAVAGHVHAVPRGVRGHHLVGGGEEAVPVVSRIPSDRNRVHLMCSDGLTKHVSDERIHERLANMTSAKQACEALLQDALDDGGTDNITIIVGRIVAKSGATPQTSVPVF